MVKTITLVKIGAIGGIVTCTMGLALRSKLSNDIKKTDFYQEAIKKVRSHQGAIYLLGEPIKDLSVDMGDSKKNYVQNSSAKYEVPLVGPKQKGTMHMWLKKVEGDEHWAVNRIELGVQNQPNKRLLILNGSEETD